MGYSESSQTEELYHISSDILNSNYHCWSGFSGYSGFATFVPYLHLYSIYPPCFLVNSAFSRGFVTSFSMGIHHRISPPAPRDTSVSSVAAATSEQKMMVVRSIGEKYSRYLVVTQNKWGILYSLQWVILILYSLQ